MSKRNRAAWWNLKRSVRLHTAAKSFAPRRAPALNGLMAATALSCSFLAFIAAPTRVQAQDANIDLVTSWGHNRGITPFGQTAGFDNFGQTFTLHSSSSIDLITLFLADNDGGPIHFTINLASITADGQAGPILWTSGALQTTQQPGDFAFDRFDATTGQFNLFAGTYLIYASNFGFDDGVADSGRIGSFNTNPYPEGQFAYNNGGSGANSGWSLAQTTWDIAFGINFSGQDTPSYCSGLTTGADTCTITENTNLTEMNDGFAGGDRVVLTTTSDLSISGETLASHFQNFETFSVEGSGVVHLSGAFNSGAVEVNGGTLALNGSIQSAGGPGVDLNAAGTALNIGSTGVINSGGLGVFGDVADLTVISAGAINSTGDGIRLSHGGDVDNSDGVITSSAGRGIQITGGGGVVSTGEINAYGDGVYISAIGTADTIDLTVDGAVTSTHGDGVVVHGGGANVSVAINAAVSGDPGVVASNTGAGDVNLPITANVSGTDGGVLVSVENGVAHIDVTNNAIIDGTNGGAGDFGIRVTATGGSIDLYGAAGTSILADTTGIYALVNGASNGAIGIDWNGTIDAGGRGVFAANQNFGSSGDVIVNLGGAVTAGNEGVRASTYGSGAVSITTGDDVTASGGTGIYGSTQTGALTIQVNGSGSVIDASGTGIRARSNTGDVYVGGAAGTAILADDRGILLSVGGGAGNVVLNWNGSIDASHGGVYGVINSGSATGDVDLTVAGAVTSGYAGVFARNFGLGDVTIATGEVTSGQQGVVGNTFGGGDVTITASGDIDAHYGAIAATGGGHMDVSVLGTGTAISSDVDQGIRARSYSGGGVSVYGEAGTALTGYSIGVYAMNNGATGDVVVNWGGSITTTYAGNFGWGVQARQTDGSSAGDVTVSVGGLITTNATGVWANTAGSGDVAVTVAGVNAGQTGVEAQSAYGSAMVTTNGAMQTGGAGVTVQGQVNGAAEINADITSGYTGVSVYSRSGTATIDVNGAGTTIDSGAAGYASGIRATTNTGDILITGEAGTAAIGHNVGIQGTINGASTGDLVIDWDGTVDGVTRSGVAARIRSQGSGDIDVSVTGAVHAGGVSYQDAGVYARNYGSGDVTVSVGDVTSSRYGVYAAMSTGGAMTVTVDGLMTTSARGVSARADFGSSTLDVNLNGDIVSQGTAIYAVNNDGLTTIDLGAGASINAVGNGIQSRMNAGAIIVSGAVGSDIQATGYGIRAASYGGVSVPGTAVDIEFDGSITSGAAAVWVRAGGADSDVVVDLGGAVTSTGNRAVTAYAMGTGDSDLTVTTSGAVSGFTAGIFAVINNGGSTGDLAVTANGTVSGQVAIQAGNYGSGLLTVYTGANGDISGQSASGIVARAATGDIVVTTYGDIGSALDRVSTQGVYALTTAGGDATVTANGDIFSDTSGVIVRTLGAGSDTTIHANGLINAPFAITARTYGAGDSDITVTQSGDLTGASNGLYAAIRNAASTGTIDLNVSGSITASNDGVWALSSASGGVIIDTTAGSIAANGYGVFLQGNGAGAASITTGAISGTALRGVEAFSTGSLTVTTAGDIGSAANGVSWDGVRTSMTGAGQLETVNINGDIFSDNTGALIRSSGANSDILIDVNGDVTAFYGVFARNYGTGDSDIAITIDGTITGSQAVYGRISGGTGSLDIDVNGTLNATNFGVRAINSGSGGVDITTGALSSISGNAVNGIYASGASGVVSINSAGAIGSAANEVSGNGLDARNTGAGSVIVTNSGAIFADQFGVYGRATAGATVNIDNQADVTAGRTGLRGVGATGAVDITNSATVTVDGTNASTSSMAIYGFSNNDVTVHNTGDLVVNSSDSNIVQGIRISANNGHAFVLSDGDITVHSNNPAATNTAGIQIADADLGVYVHVAGDIVVQGAGQNFAALLVSNTAGDVDVDLAYFHVTGVANGAGLEIRALAGSSVVVNVDEGHVYGANAEAIVVYGSADDVTVTGGTLTSLGDDSQGVLVRTPGGPISVDVGSISTNGTNAHAIDVGSNGHIDVTAHDISTQGTGSQGVRAIGGAGGVTVTTTAGGDFTTSGAGIVASTAGSLTGDINIYAHGAIDAGGYGIVATSNGGAINVVADDTITSASGFGVYAAAAGAGHVQVSVQDVSANRDGVNAASAGGGVQVQTAGDITSTVGDGIHARETTGDIVITTAAGTTITALFDDGIDAATTGGNVFVTSRADIVADPGILIVTGGAGNINVDSFGAITANNGGIVTSSQAGYNHVQVYGTVEGDADDNGTGDAIHATSNGGDVYVYTSADGDIVGNNVNGIFAANTGATANGVTIRSQGDIGALGQAVDADGVHAEIIGAGSTGAMGLYVEGAVFAGGDGVYGLSGMGDVTVFTGPTGITAGGSGIRIVETGGGGAEVSITSTGAITAGSDGINAFATTGSGAMTIASSGLIDAGGTGIYAVNLSGDITVDHTGGITGAAAQGIFVSAVNGQGVVHNNAAIGSLADAVTGYGIAVFGYDLASIDGTGAIFAGSDGIQTSTGGANGQTIVSLSASADIVAGGAGIRAGSNGGDVTIDTAGTITAGAAGIFGYVQAGLGTIRVTATDTIDATTYGIFTTADAGSTVITTGAAADISGNAAVGIYAFGNGAITIHNSGDIGSALNGVTEQGILVRSAGSILIDGSGAIFAGSDGIYARSYLGADIDILLTSATADISAGADGVHALASNTGDSGITVLTNGTVTGGDDGIWAHVSDPANTGSVTITANDAVVATAGDGVNALSQLGSVYVRTGSTVNSGDDGIDAVAAGGTGSADVRAVGAITAGGDGIVAISNGGLVRAFAYSTVDATSGFGLYAHSNGAGYVRAFANGISSNLDGVNAGSAGGNVYVQSYGDITSTSGDGIHAINTSGDITIYTQGGYTITAVAGDGIDAATTGGNVVVTSRADIVADPGILIVTGGAGNITVSSFGAITANNGGIVTSSQTGYNHVYVYGTVEGDADDNGSGDAIHATSNGGDVYVFTAGGGDIVGSNHNGVFAANTGATADGVRVRTQSDIGSAVTPVDADGIDAFITNGGSTGQATVRAYGSIFAGDDGIYGYNAGSGDVVIYTSAAGDIVAGTTGLRGRSTGDGDITITSNGAILAGQYGINARITNAASTGAITITANDAITGALTGWGVYAYNAGTGGTTVTTGAAGDISGNAYGGIVATTGGGGVTVHNNGDIGDAGNSVSGYGILVSEGALTFGDVLVDGSGAIFAGGVGIRARNYALDGNVSVNLTAASADITAGGDGISAAVFGGGSADVTVFTNGTITAGANGIFGYSNGGSTVMTVTNNDVIDATGQGIRAINNGTGGTTVNQNAAITGAATWGIVATSAGANITVHNNAAIGSSVNATTNDGVYAALNGGSGTILVDGSGAIFAGDDGIDARANSAGSDININLTNAAADITSGDDGIYATATSTGDQDITVFMNGTLTGAGDGVDARITNAANTGTVSITLNDAVTMSGPASWGTRVDNQGTGGITIVTSAAGDISGNAFGGHLLNAGGGTVSVSGSGDIGSSVNAVTNDGVRVTGSASLISMTGSGPVFAGDDGFDLNTSGAGGDIVVNLPANAIIRSVDDGVYASAAGTGDSDITITLAGSVISTTGNAVDARITNAANTGTLIINANASLTGGGTSAAVNGVNNGVSGTSTSALNIASGVVITGGVVGGASYAIDFDGGPSTTINNGAINGFVNLTDSGDVITNNNLWNALGAGASASLFGLGNDTVNNTSNARIEVAPLAATATTVTWTGLEAFNNQGGVVDLRQGHVGDVFSMVGATFTGTTSGPNASRLQIDAAFGSTITADRLVIGAAAGQTTIQLVDLTPSLVGAIDTTGALVVDATSGVSSAFTLEGGPIHKGFVTYQLAFDAAGSDWRLVGLPGQGAFQFVKLGQATQDYWGRSGDAWTSRMAEVRDAQAQIDPTRGEGWEMWGQAQVGGQDQDSHPTYTIGLVTSTPDLSTSSDWRGFQMGADKLGGNVLYGMTGGFIQQETSFDATGDSFDIEGWNLGGYLGWSAGPFFANGLVKGDMFSVDANIHSVPSVASFDGTTIGAKGEIGMRLGGARLYIEPRADIAYAKTDLDDAVFPVLATSFKFNDTTSNRGSIGARIGGTWGSIAPYVGAYAVQEFDGENRMTMFTGAGCPSCMTVNDVAPGSYGKVEYGFTLLNWSGLEGFVKGETAFSGDYSGTTVRLGARWRW